MGLAVWTRHDRAGSPGGALTSHCFVKNLKKYAKEAGVDDKEIERLQALEQALDLVRSAGKVRPVVAESAL